MIDDLVTAFLVAFAAVTACIGQERDGPQHGVRTAIPKASPLASAERDGELRIGDILSEEEAQAVWREAAATAATTPP